MWRPMKVVWLIETVVFEDHFDAMADQIAALGQRCITVHSGKADYHRGEDDLDIQPDEVVIYRGSLEYGAVLAQQAKERGWTLAPFLYGPQYDCSSYYPCFGDDLLNERYLMLPFGELLRRKWWLYRTLGEDGALFIRPNAGNKRFIGQLVYDEHFEKDLPRLGFYEVRPEEMVVVARPINIEREFRWLVVNGKVVTGATYKGDKGSLTESVRAHINAQEMLDRSGFNPAPVWCMDTCVTKANNQRVLEVGAFSSAGLYDIKMDVLVPAVAGALEQSADPVALS